MFELSDFLVGIYKVNDCTNSVTIENHPPLKDPASKNLYLDSFVTPSQPPAFEATILPEEEKENERSNVQLPLTPPSQEMQDVVMEQEVGA
jgi:structural maintenance of chromosome 4